MFTPTFWFVKSFWHGWPFPHDIVLFIWRYLRNQTASIRWNDKFSGYRTIEWSVRQGGIISPFLFNFYINTIIDEISSLQVGCRLGLIRLNIVVYADDVVLLENSPEHANEKFKCLIDKHKLKINEVKSQCMIFRVSNNVPNTILTSSGLDS